jgi:hypothetical protein
MALDLTALSAYTTEHAEEFFAKSVMKSKTAGLMNVLSNFKPGTHKLPDFSHDYDLFQDGSSCGWNASGDLTIAQRSITVESLKINTSYCMRDLEAKFTRQIMPQGQEYDGLEPIAAGLLGELDKAVGKMVELTLWNGNKATAPNAISSYDLVNGLNKVIADETGNLAYEGATGALTTSNIIGAVEALYDGLGVDAYSTINTDQWVVLMGDDKTKMYERAYRDTHGAVVYNQGFEKRYVDGTNIEIVGVPGLNGTDKLVLAKRDNLILAVDVDGEEMDFKVFMDQYEENVLVKARFALGIQIHFPSEVAVDNY